LSKICLFLICFFLICVPRTWAQNPRQPGQLTAPYVPLSREDKFKYRFFEIVGPRGLAFLSLGAGFEQIEDTPKEWHGGMEGYAKRYASTLGAALFDEGLSAGLESALHEDPRYFPLDGPSKRARVWNALKQTFITRTDSGATTFAYGHVASAFATGQLTRAWMPGSSNSALDGMRTTGISLGADAAINLLYEFVPSSRPK